MCTAIYDGKNYLFGRTLDLEYSYNESVIATPKNFLMKLRCEKSFYTQYRILGMGIERQGFPLYYDAMNEKGLAMAGLNFPKNAVYFEEKKEKLNLAPFELIPYVLGKCQTVDEALFFLEKLNICHISFSKDLSVTPMHWMIADKQRSLVIESVKNGLNLYENDVGVLTNEPPFWYHRTRLEDFKNLSVTEKGTAYTRGLASYGLPGDYSSVSRFVRASFFLKNSTVKGSAITQFYKIFDTVCVPRGAIVLENGEEVITQYTSCMDLVNGIYYYKTYENSRLCGVRFPKEKEDRLIIYPLSMQQDIQFFE